MSDQDTGPAGAPEEPPTREYPLKDTASALNERLGLYLSEEQQRGLAIGLLVGAALGAAIMAWSVADSIRRGD